MPSPVSVSYQIPAHYTRARSWSAMADYRAKRVATFGTDVAYKIPFDIPFHYRMGTPAFEVLFMIGWNKYADELEEASNNE